MTIVGDNGLSCTVTERESGMGGGVRVCQGFTRSSHKGPCTPHGFIVSYAVQDVSIDCEFVLTYH